MRKFRILAWFLLFALTAAAARDPETIDDLKRRAEAAKAGDRPKLYLTVAQRQLDAANNAFNRGENEAGQAAVEDAVTSCERAASAAVESRKHLKDSEIKIRELTRKLESLRRSLGFEEREPMQHAVDRMNDARNQLAAAMFGPKS